jgi:uncharacterized membrane protein
MKFFARFSRGKLPLGRIEAFSDGVFAIIVTLLVLEIKVPALRDASSVQELSGHLREFLPRFFGWMISFIIVCKFWLNHHHLFRQARHANYALVWMNAIFLMFQAFVPFPTALMGEYPANPLAVSLFGVVMALNTLLFILLQGYIIRNLLKPEFVGLQDPHLLRKSLVGIAAYLVGVGGAWINVNIAFVAYAITPLLFIVPARIKGGEDL